MPELPARTKLRRSVKLSSLMLAKRIVRNRNESLYSLTLRRGLRHSQPAAVAQPLSFGSRSKSRRISTAAQLASSSSATYSCPSGPKAKSMIDVKPPFEYLLAVRARAAIDPVGIR